GAAQAMSASQTEDPVAVRLAELKSSRAAVRRDAARALALIERPDRRLFVRLVVGLDDADTSVRLAVAQTLQRVGGAAVPVLVEAIADADVDLRLAIIRTLGMMGPAARGALPALALLADDPQLASAVGQAMNNIRHGPPVDWNRILERLSGWFLVGGAAVEVACLVLHWSGLFAQTSGTALPIAVAWAVLGAYFGAVLGAGLHGRRGVCLGASYPGFGG